MFNLLQSCCCCCVKKWESDKSGWYSRQKRIGKKLEIAKELFNSEVDLQTMLN